jgi:hypothetical protein
MRRLYLGTVVSLSIAVAVPGAALAADPGYIDDRSDAASLVRSFYNAVNRREFARAWDYFGDTKPAASFEAFVQGFAGTERVDVVTGAASAEGATGSQFFAIPVAIAAFARDGSEQVFAGCYTARLADPQIQEPPFHALHIEKAQMSASVQPFEEQLPASCGDAPPAVVDAALEKAKRMFAAAHADDCEAIRPDGAGDAPEIYDIAFRYATSAEGDPDSQARLFRFYCSTGAYNESHIYYLDKVGEGLEELYFAVPDLDIHYVGNDTDGKVDRIGIFGYLAETRLVNSSYDAATTSITSYSKWRGVGDASSSGTWLFRDGAFTLVRYEVDASYDGEINPETVLDYNTAP